MNWLKIKFVLVLLFLSVNLLSQNLVHVVFLAGQSNMAGAGNYNELDPSFQKRIETVSKRVMLSVNGEAPRPLNYTYSDYQKKKRGFGEVFGPELFLGLTLGEAYPQKEFLLIKVAQGGTSLYGAWNPEWSIHKAKEVENGEMKQNLKLYQKHIDIIHNNLKIIEEVGKSYKIMGAIWMQGENDAAFEVSARSYQANLIKLIYFYRSEFNVPNMPFVIGQINSHYGRFRDGPTIVREAMINVADSDSNVSVVTTVFDSPWIDYPKHSDNVHYNTEGQRLLGKSFAVELLKLFK